MSVVRIRESPYYGKKIYENFVETTVRNREVSLPRGSTVVTETFEKWAPSKMPTHCQSWL